MSATTIIILVVVGIVVVLILFLGSFTANSFIYFQF